MEPTPEQIGARILAAVEEVTDKDRPGHIALTRLAADLGISLSTLHRWMNGTNHPSYAKMVLLASITGKPLDWFMQPDRKPRAVA